MGAVVVYAELLMLAGCQGNGKVLARFPDILDILESIKKGKVVNSILPESFFYCAIPL